MLILVIGIINLSTNCVSPQYPDAVAASFAKLMGETAHVITLAAVIGRRLSFDLLPILGSN